MVTQLSPTEFTWIRYLEVIFSWESIKTTKNYIATLLAMDIVGYCDGAVIEIRPSPNYYAVMFETDNYQSWCHIPKKAFDAYLEELK